MHPTSRSDSPVRFHFLSPVLAPPLTHTYPSATVSQDFVDLFVAIYCTALANYSSHLYKPVLYVPLLQFSYCLDVKVFVVEAPGTFVVTEENSRIQRVLKCFPSFSKVSKKSSLPSFFSFQRSSSFVPKELPKSSTELKAITGSPQKITYHFINFYPPSPTRLFASSSLASPLRSPFPSSPRYCLRLELRVVSSVFCVP